MGIINGQIIELIARSARLTAERDGSGKIAFPTALFDMEGDAKRIAAGEVKLFDANMTNQESQKAQLKLQIEQLYQEIAGIKAQREGKRGQLDLIERELEQIKKLYRKKLTSVTRVYSMEREAKRLGGEHGGLIAQTARAKGKISEIELQILSIGQTARVQAQRELRTIEAKLAELKERKVAAVDRLKRCDLRAPQSGFVHELAVHTIGGVIVSAEPVLLIVPKDEKLAVEVRFAPVDIDQIIIGRKVKLRFSAFDQKTTPEIDGKVSSVSADIASDSATGQNFYRGRIEIDSEFKDQFNALKLLPGMPVEAFITTGDRTALSYLLKPVSDQFQRALREN